MRIGVAGLGHMGGNTSRRLMKAGRQCEEPAPAEAPSPALDARFRSREAHSFGATLLSAMRFGFGGHIEGSEPIAERKPAKARAHAPAPKAAE